MLNIETGLAMLVIALCALLSPNLTAVINNRHQRKMKRMELEHEDRCRREQLNRDVFSAYFSAAWSCITTPDARPYYIGYGLPYSTALLFASEETKIAMLKLDRVIRGVEIEDKLASYMAVVDSIRTDTGPSPSKR